MEQHPTLVEDADSHESASGEIPIEPADALSEQLDRVKIHGDPLDAVTSLSLTAAGIRAALAAAAYAEFSYVTPGRTPGLELTMGAVALGGALLYEAARGRSVDRIRATRRLWEDTIDAADDTEQFNEFYRTGVPFRRDVTLMWYGQPETATNLTDQRTSMLRTARLAKQVGVSRIAAPASATEPWIDGVMEPYGSFQKWLLHRKQRLVMGSAAHDKVYESTPDGWIDAVYQSQNKETSSTVEGLIRKLETIYDKHPVVTAAHLFEQANLEVRHQKILNAAQLMFDRRLEDIEVTRNRYPQHGEREKIPVYVSGSLTTEDRIQRFINYHADCTSSVAVQLNLTDERIKVLLQYPESDPMRAAEAIELTLIRLLKEARQPEVAIAAHGSGDQDKEPKDPIPYQALLLRLNKRSKEHKRPKLIGHRIGRLVLAASLAIGAGFAYHTAQAAADRYENRVANTALKQVDHMLGLRANNNEVTGNQIVEQTYKDYPWLRYWDDNKRYAYDLEQKIANGATTPTNLCFGPCPPGHDSTAINSPSSLGNAGDGLPNQVEWNLQPHNMSPAGYWDANTANELDANAQGINTGFPLIFWVGNGYSPTTHGSQLPETFDPTQHPAYIKVSRHLVDGVNGGGDAFVAEGQATNTNSTGSSTEPGYSTLKMNNFYYLPVRYDSSPVALRYVYDGHLVPVKLMPQPDGTYNISLPSNEDTGELTYWIVPSHDVPHELKPNYYKGPMPYDQAALYADIARTLDPGFYHQTPAERAASVAAAIANKFTYEVDPLSPNEMYGVHSLDGYEERIIASRTANCNEANSTEALVDPALTTVTGYFDDGSPDQMKGLYSHSLHMYDVDGHGRIYDATPLRVPPAQEAYFSTTPPKPPQPASPLPWELGGAALLMGGIGLWQRRRIARGIQCARSAYGGRLQRQLAAQGDIALLNTVELAQRSLYAPSLDTAAALDRVKQRQNVADQEAVRQNAGLSDTAVATLRIVTADDTAAKLTKRPDLHAPRTARTIKHARSQVSDPAAVQALKTSERILRKARVARHILPKERGRRQPRK